MLDVRWLEDFLAIANTRNFRKAAELRNVTQSGLSRRVQSLEHWAGTPLIDRAAMPLALTEAGRDLHPVATQVVHGLAQLRQQLGERATRDARIVRFTAPHLLSTIFFPDWLPRVNRISDNTDIVVVSQNLLDCFEALDRADAHFVVCLADPARSIMGRIPEQFRVDAEMMAKVGEERLIPVSAPDGAGRPRHALGAGPAALLQYTPECSIGWSVDMLLQTRADIDTRVVSTNPFADGLRLMVSGGLGLAWLPHSLVRRELDAGTLVRAADEDFDIALDVVVIRPTYRLSTRGERIWRHLGEGMLASGTALMPPSLHLISG